MEGWSIENGVCCTYDTGTADTEPQLTKVVQLVDTGARQAGPDKPVRGVFGDAAFASYERQASCTCHTVKHKSH